MHEMQTIVTDVCSVYQSVCHTAQFGGTCSVCGICLITLGSCYYQLQGHQIRFFTLYAIALCNWLYNMVEWAKPVAKMTCNVSSVTLSLYSLSVIFVACIDSKMNLHLILAVRALLLH